MTGWNFRNRSYMPGEMEDYFYPAIKSFLSLREECLDLLLSRIISKILYIYSGFTNAVEQWSIVSAQLLQTYFEVNYSEETMANIISFSILLVVTTCLIVLFSCSRHTDTLQQIPSLSNEIRSEPNEENDEEELSIFDLAKTSYRHEHAESVIHLVKTLHIDVNYQKQSSGLSLFLCACIGGNMKLIMFLLAEGANLKVYSYHGDSCLYLSVFGTSTDSEKQTKVAKLLLSKGSPVNVQNRAGNTVLHQAAYVGNITLITLLLQHGADSTLANIHGILPIDCAVSAGHMKAASLLEVNVSNPHVWDIMEPYTPTKIKLGLFSPRKNHLVRSSKPKKMDIMYTYKDKVVGAF